MFEFQGKIHSTYKFISCFPCMFPIGNTPLFPISNMPLL